jgi:hypothetical protein
MHETNDRTEAVAQVAAFAITRLVEAFGSQGFAADAAVLRATHTTLEQALQAIDRSIPDDVVVLLSPEVRARLPDDIADQTEREMQIAVGRLTGSMMAHAAAQMAWMAYRAEAEKAKAAASVSVN